MALSISLLGSEMMAAVESNSPTITAATQLILLGNAITAHVIANLEVIWGWSGYNSMYLPDGSTELTGECTSYNITLVPSLLTTHEGAQANLATQISVQTIATCTLEITQDGCSGFSPLICSDYPGLSIPVSIFVNNTDRLSCFTKIAERIVNSFTSYSPAEVLSGDHNAFTGSTTSCTLI